VEFGLVSWLSIWRFVISGLVLVGISSCVIRDRRLEIDFKEVKIGMSLQDAERLMGSPSWNSDCESGPLPETRKPANCARELGYAATLAWTGFAPEWWIVWLGADGAVIRTAKIVSP
jgi:hypothetical protein